VAQNFKFDLAEISVPPNTPFRIVFDNQDAGVPHNVAIYDSGPGGAALFTWGDLQRGRDRDLRCPGPAGRQPLLPVRRAPHDERDGSSSMISIRRRRQADLIGPTGSRADGNPPGR